VDVEASQLIPTLVPVALDTSLSVVQRMRKAMGLNAPPAKLKGFKAAECKMFCDGMRTILDIRNAVSAEFGAVPVADVLQHFRDLEQQGAVTIRRKK
ncbi:MAG: hypothetical protein HY710_09195, partial [Candidatus Latescibacteria bacterium]|nr:hypothetical protein [Candidatus Latescibacterota bacterium]